MYAFDFEVYRYDWLVVFKNIDSGDFEIIHNDNEKLENFMNRKPFLIGFNNKWYDNHILKAILMGADNKRVKEINDIIIGGTSGYEIDWLRQNRAIWFDSMDMFDDVQQGLSLKAIEAHLGMDIEEASVPFDLNRPLTEAELLSTIEYCKYDVNMVDKLIDIRQDYISAKLMLARMKGLPEKQALYSTNAKLAAMFLKANRIEHNDEREYVFPDNLKMEFIPRDVLDFFLQIYSPIPSNELFSLKLDTLIAGVPTTYGFGGLHGSKEQYFEQATDKRVIQLADVGSMYPSLMIEYGYSSRNIPSFDEFKEVYNTRMNAKRTGDKETDSALKLILNTKFGAMGNKYNNLHDPLQFRSVCITGQLLLTSLAIELSQNCQTLEVLNLNTDGIMYSVDTSELSKVESICKGWEQNSRLNLEILDIEKVYLKDVNNLIFRTKSGSVGKSGGYLNYGISVKGAWNINNNHTIVKDAVERYLMGNIPPETTINDCQDIFKFQIIAKASSLYSKVFHNDIEVQRCNRVYASPNKSLGTLYKLHKQTGTLSKIAGLPESCLVDNKNQLEISDIDKGWYIALANRYIDDFAQKNESLF